MLKTAMPIGDHMVLQREQEILLWGSYDGSEDVILRFHGAEVKAKRDGEKWQAIFPPMPASGGETLSITAGEETLTFADVAVGEVWVAGGQSNMEFPMFYDADYSAELEICENPDIRFFDMPEFVLKEQLSERDYSRFGFWRPCTPENLGPYSAVGYYFAKEIYASLHVPVGILGCNWGGTPACSWIREDYLEREHVRVWLDEYIEQTKDLDLEAYEKLVKSSPSYYRDNHLEDPVTARMLAYKTEEQQREYEDNLADMMAASGAELMPPVGPLSDHAPGRLYHSMLSEIIGFGMRGAIWYQGESDEFHPFIYAQTMGALVDCWRDAWGKKFPFLYVQLAPFDHWLHCTGEQYPILRQQQELFSQTGEDVYMASIMDSGLAWDIHPKNKRPVGMRLGLLARNKVYAEDVPADAPIGTDATWESEKLRIAMAHVGEGLTVKGKHIHDLQVFVDGKEIDGFEAVVEGDCILLGGPSLTAAKGSVVEVRLAWKPYAEVNLYNSAGLSAKPFRLTTV